MVDVNWLGNNDFWKHMGMSVVWDEEGRGIGVSIKKSDRLKQSYGNYHGGVVATAVDAAVAVIVNEAIGKEHVASTVELKLNFLRPATNSDLISYGKIIKKGKSLIVGWAEVYDEQDHLISTGMATYKVSARK